MLSEETLNVIRALPEIELKKLAPILAGATASYFSIPLKDVKDMDSDWHNRKEQRDNYRYLIKDAVNKKEIECMVKDIIKYPDSGGLGSLAWRSEGVDNCPRVIDTLYFISLPSLKEWLHSKGINTRLFPLEKIADNPAKGTSIIESSILELINKEGCNPLALPMVKNGIAGIKASIKNKTDKSVSSKSFDKGWSSLLKKGLIKDLSVNNLQYSPKAFNL